ncbi:hypothetical protein NP493_1582g00029 [Ridgeia piscesae]|uniref:Uncharacterized protein n=1 Tax=Ridgeia piscesae TaxID=27915 RepID=A0AAD9NAG9_RIDPI|nr:hypothetical protein NP493_1582g00029 [Ridgeia piscesae]
MLLCGESCILRHNCPRPASRGNSSTTKSNSSRCLSLPVRPATEVIGRRLKLPVLMQSRFLAQTCAHIKLRFGTLSKSQLRRTSFAYKHLIVGRFFGVGA